VDTYRNLQQHRAVLPAITRLSCVTELQCLIFGDKPARIVERVEQKAIIVEWQLDCVD